jgi:hypothetical protein
MSIIFVDATGSPPLSGRAARVNADQSTGRFTTPGGTGEERPPGVHTPGDFPVVPSGLQVFSPEGAARE